MASVLLSASVERCFVSRVRDFFLGYGRNQSGCEKDNKKSWIFAFYTLGFLDHLHVLLWWKLPWRNILCHVIADTKAQFSEFKLGLKLFQFERNEILEIVTKIQEILNLCTEWIHRFVDQILKYYDWPLPIGLHEIIKILQIWLNKPQCGHREGQKFSIFWWNNHQGESSYIRL